MTNNIRFEVYELQIEYGSFIKTSITRQYIKVIDTWYYKDSGIQRGWYKCASGTIRVFSGDSRYIITPKGKALVNGSIKVDVDKLPR